MMLEAMLYSNNNNKVGTYHSAIVGNFFFWQKTFSYFLLVCRGLTCHPKNILALTIWNVLDILSC